MTNDGAKLLIPPNGGVALHEVDPSLQRRPGRPLGSKNKQKEPTLNDLLTRQIIIEIESGCDIIQALAKVVCQIDSSITVLSGVGLISHATIGHPIPQIEPKIINGSYAICGFSGTMGLDNVTRDIAEGKSSLVMLPSNTSISISIADAQGNVQGGGVSGKLIAEGTVTIVANAWK